MAKLPVTGETTDLHPFGASVPVDPPESTVSIDEGPHLLIKSVEGQALINDAINQAIGGYTPVIRVNKGPAIRYDVTETLTQLRALRDVNDPTV